jgi:hypothetical protein
MLDEWNNGLESVKISLDGIYQICSPTFQYSNVSLGHVNKLNRRDH